MNIVCVWDTPTKPPKPLLLIQYGGSAYYLCTEQGFYFNNGKVTTEGSPQYFQSARDAIQAAKDAGHPILPMTAWYSPIAAKTHPVHVYLSDDGVTEVECTSVSHNPLPFPYTEKRGFVTDYLYTKESNDPQPQD